MNVEDLVANARDALTVGRVFGEPVTHDGVTVIPVARISGGAGGGSGEPGSGTGKNEGGAGGGFGLGVSPAGVFTLREGKVSWQPAINVNRVILGGQVVAVVALLTLRAYFRFRAAGQR